MEMPPRSALKGRQGRLSRACRELKPSRVREQRVSTPPTMAASIMSAAISRWAVARGLALEVQAVEVTQAGPFAPLSVATTRSREPKVCCCWKS